MKLLHIITAFIFISNFGFSQKIIKHKVAQGESIFVIAKNYNVTQAEVVALNPKYKNGILQLNTVLEIPNKKYKEEKVKLKEKKVSNKKEKLEIIKSTNPLFTTHLVLPKETLYSISKKYGVTMELICETNPQLKTAALKLGSKIKIPNNKAEIQTENKIDISSKSAVIALKSTEDITPITVGTVIHKVQPKETLYKISRMFNVNVKDLQDLNPSIKNGLPVGYNLIVKKGNDSVLINEVDVKPLETTLNEPNFNDNSAKADFLIAQASHYIGTNYRRGGTSSAGFDCSGFMLATYKEIDLLLPRTSKEQSNYGYKIDKSQAQKGDLIFFSTNKRGNINHVGMIIEVLPDEIKFIHSSTSNGVMVSSDNEEYYAKRFIQINRILSE